MRLSYRLAAAALAALALAACNSNDPKGNKTAGSSSPTSQTPRPNPSAHVAPADGVKRITTVELRDALANGTAVVVDVRPAQSYQQSRIKGSISIPLEQVASRLSELPRDKMIVTYCS
ncbi:MAG TPA: rhodanese-like domain-containing protein [Pyrinomonadaceae bacterium]|nr:rhodanese-like domain-containing protein [Pyrinomonadaceae bacterium]